MGLQNTQRYEGVLNSHYAYSQVITASFLAYFRIPLASRLGTVLGPIYSYLFSFHTHLIYKTFVYIYYLM